MSFTRDLYQSLLRIAIIHCYGILLTVAKDCCCHLQGSYIVRYYGLLFSEPREFYYPPLRAVIDIF